MASPHPDPPASSWFDLSRPDNPSPEQENTEAVVEEKRPSAREPDSLAGGSGNGLEPLSLSSSSNPKAARPSSDIQQVRAIAKSWDEEDREAKQRERRRANSGNSSSHHTATTTANTAPVTIKHHAHQPFPHEKFGHHTTTDPPGATKRHEHRAFPHEKFGHGRQGLPQIQCVDTTLERAGGGVAEEAVIDDDAQCQGPSGSNSSEPGAPLLEATLVPQDSAGSQEEIPQAQIVEDLPLLAKCTPRSNGAKLFCFGVLVLITIVVLVGIVVGAGNVADGGDSTVNNNTEPSVLEQSIPTGSPTSSRPLISGGSSAIINPPVEPISNRPSTYSPTGMPTLAPTDRPTLTPTERPGESDSAITDSGPVDDFTSGITPPPAITEVPIQSEEETEAPTEAPVVETVAPTVAQDIEVTDTPTDNGLVDLLAILPEYTLAAFEDPLSPQARARLFIQYDPLYDTKGEARVIQRFVLTTLYFALGDEWDKGLASPTTDECLWFADTGSFCNDDGLMEGLLLGNNNLDLGPIPAEIGLLSFLRERGMSTL